MGGNGPWEGSFILIDRIILNFVNWPIESKQDKILSQMHLVTYLHVLWLLKSNSIEWEWVGCIPPKVRYGVNTEAFKVSSYSNFMWISCWIKSYYNHSLYYKNIFRKHHTIKLPSSYANDVLFSSSLAC